MFRKVIFHALPNVLSKGWRQATAFFEPGSLIKQRITVAALAMLGAAPFAVAADLGKVAENASGSLNALGLTAQAFFAFCGLILIGVSVFTFIKHNKTEGRGAKLSTAFIYLIGGGLLFYIASLIQTTGDTVWGEGQGNRGRVMLRR